MTEQGWRDNLKKGDEVFVSQSFSRTPEKEMVSRVTATQVFIRLNERYEKAFRKKDGYNVGGSSFHRNRIFMPTDEIRARVELAELMQKARNLREKLAIPRDKETLLKFIAAIEPFTLPSPPR